MGAGERVVVAHSLGCLLWLHAAAEGLVDPVADRVLLVAPPSPAVTSSYARDGRLPGAGGPGAVWRSRGPTCAWCAPTPTRTAPRARRPSCTAARSGWTARCCPGPGTSRSRTATGPGPRRWTGPGPGHPVRVRLTGALDGRLPSVPWRRFHPRPRSRSASAGPPTASGSRTPASARGRRWSSPPAGSATSSTTAEPGLAALRPAARRGSRRVPVRRARLRPLRLGRHGLLASRPGSPTWRRWSRPPGSTGSRCSAMSQGGPVAIAYAHRHPERVTRLVLLGSYVGARVDDGSEESLRAGGDVHQDDQGRLGPAGGPVPPGVHRRC